jgi:SAM-dependent methyltransferase
VAKDLLATARRRLGDLSTDLGMTHAGLDLAESLRYIDGVFGDYRRYGSVSRFEGRVAEVGPGDSCGVGLLFLADGCSQVDLVERGTPIHDAAQIRELHRAIAARHPVLDQACSRGDARAEDLFEGLTWHRDAGAESFFENRQGEYDFIVSRAVLEHVDDVEKSLVGMAAALKPGGRMLHMVDLRDHGLFHPPHHELAFLETPQWLHRLMTRGAGRPNRVLTHEYRRILRSTGLTCEYLVTRVVGAGAIEPHRPWSEISAEVREHAIRVVRAQRHRLAAEFLDVADEDLAVAGLFIVAQKQHARAA